MFKWSIDKVRVADGNLVVEVEWRVTATQGELTASAVGFKSLVRGDSFIPYEELTEQQVLDWCFAPEVITWTDRENGQQSVTKYLKNEGEAQVTDQIERQLAKKEQEPALPWINSVGN
jgi:hypothetical protein